MHEFLHYLTLPYLLTGALVAIEIAVIAFAVALVIGYVCGFILESRHLTPLRWLVSAYIWVVRGTPILMQLLIWYNFLPLAGIHINSFITAIIALSVCYSAYICESVRSGLMAVGMGQTDAGLSLGFNPLHVIKFIRFPQATTITMPNLANYAILILKDTSLTSVIAVSELTLRSNNIVARNLEFVPVFAASTAIYLILTSLVTIADHWCEGALDYRAKEHRLKKTWSRRKPERHADAHVADVLKRFVSAMPPDVGEFGVECRDVSKSFYGVPALEHVNIKFRKGETTCIIGPSGSGKSTLLRTINHLESIDSGEILVGGRLVGYKRRRDGAVVVRRNLFRIAKERVASGTGMVFQQFHLLQNFSVLANISLAPRHIHGFTRDKAEADARILLRALGLEHLEYRMPQRLSGGEQQRIAILRVLACRPDVILFDEPTSALDPERVGEVLDVMAAISALDITMIVVTHEIEFARKAADWVVFMEAGHVVEEGPPDRILSTPSTERAREFIGVGNA